MGHQCSSEEVHSKSIIASPVVVEQVSFSSAISNATATSTKKMCITRVPSNAELTEASKPLAKTTVASFGKSDVNAASSKGRIHVQGRTRADPSPAAESCFLSSLSTPTCLAIGLTTSALVTLFSLYFPFWLAPVAASKTYFLAFYHYDEPSLHHFDITAWSWGTDYGLAVVMSLWSWRLYQHRTPATMPLCQRIWGLILGYAVSVTAGALAHQFYHTQQIRNTWHFRLLWTICVGSVTFASQPMGCIASEIAKQFQPHTTTTSSTAARTTTTYIPQVPELIWRCTAITTTAVCALGWFSYHRPACDIFIAGITQFPTSFYMMIVLWQIKSDPSMAAYINHTYLWMGILAFIANAPLLPLYPLLVQYTDWSLAKVNTFLHTWLLITWSMQAISLTHVQKAVTTLQQKPPKAVPLVHQQHNAAASTIKKEN